MRGLAMAARTLGPSAGQQFQVTVRDSVEGASHASAAIEELAREDVIAVVGPLDAATVRAAGEEANDEEIPLVSLSPRGGAASGGASAYVFHIVHSAETRARALARYAVENGVKDFAILGPSSAYGRAVGGAFAREVTRLGGTVVARATYNARATSFSDAVKQLQKPWRAIFVPDQARRLSLIAPALAAANFAARPVGSRPSRKGPRNILLLSTAELVDERYLRSTGRYSWGAVLAPGFYPDRKDALIGPFVTDYEAEHRGVPTALEAYAYDAALLVSAALQQGAYRRADLARKMADVQVEGLTGLIRFDNAHDRGDNGILFQVERLPSGEHELRAIR